MHTLLIIALWVFILPTAIGVLLLILSGISLLICAIFKLKDSKIIRELSNYKPPR